MLHSCPVCRMICTRPGAVLICLSLHRNINWKKVSNYKFLTKEVYELIKHELQFHAFY